MDIFTLLSKNNESTWVKIVTAAVIAGLMQASIVVVINSAAYNIAEGGLNLRYFLLFLLSVTGYGVANYYAANKTVALTSHVIFAMYERMADKLRNADLRSFEKIGKNTIYQRLYTNSDIIMETAKTLPSVGASLVMIVFCAFYIAYLSLTAIFVVVVFYAFGTFIYLSINKQTVAKITAASRRESEFKKTFRHFIEGFKELKINRKKSEDLLQNYTATASQLANQDKTAMEKTLEQANVFVQCFYYTLIAFIVFLLPQISALSPAAIVTIAAVVLFSYGSVTRVVMSIPLILKATNAIEKVQSLEADLDAADDTQQFSEEELPKATPSELCLKEALFRYTEIENHPFTVGPINFSVKTGEIAFIVGENGSGKSTLLKLMAGLYCPEKGTLAYNGQTLSPENYGHYREQLSVIFTDFHLFDRFYGMTSVNKADVDGLLSKMALEKSTEFVAGQFSNLKLSQGQKKRLALLYSNLEDKEILIFDEIASDLDPTFRKYFYEQYLPELAAKGKMIIVACHDEKYFHMANTTLQLHAGKMI
jgi:putative ATP-binding cassette transporter